MIYVDTIRAESNLVAYWRLGESAGTTMADASGNANNGTYSGVTLAQTGPLLIDGTAVLFGGGADSTVTHSASLALTGDITLEAWVKTTFSAVQGGIVSKFAGSSPFPGWGMNVRSGKLGMWVGDNTNGYVNSSASINNGAWRYVVATLTGTTVRLYIDSVLDTTATRTPSRTNTTDLAIGRDSGALADYITGTLDEIAVYSKALSQADITRHYAAASEDPVAGKMAWYGTQHHDRGAMLGQYRLTKSRSVVVPGGSALGDVPRPDGDSSSPDARPVWHVPLHLPDLYARDRAGRLNAARALGAMGDIERPDAADQLPATRPVWFTQLEVPDLTAVDRRVKYLSAIASGSRGDTVRPDAPDPLPASQPVWFVPLELPVRVPRSRAERRHTSQWHAFGIPPILEEVTADRFSPQDQWPQRRRRAAWLEGFSTDGLHLADAETVFSPAFDAPLSRVVLARRRPLWLPGTAITEPTLIPEDPFNAPSLMWHVAMALPVRKPKARGPSSFYPWDSLVLHPDFVFERPDMKFHVQLAAPQIRRRRMPPGLPLGGIDLDAAQRAEVVFPAPFTLTLSLPPDRRRRVLSPHGYAAAMLPALLAESPHPEALAWLERLVQRRGLPRWMTGMADGSLLEPAGFTIPLIVRAKKYMLAGGFWRARM